jgi:hypothetical protein
MIPIAMDLVSSVPSAVDPLFSKIIIVLEFHDLQVRFQILGHHFGITGMGCNLLKLVAWASNRNVDLPIRFGQRNALHVWK